MGYGPRQKQVRLYRGQIPSPGRPTVAWREDRVRFWAAIARGAKTEDACVEARVSGPVGFRWFRHAGGVNPCLPPAVSGRYLSFAEREDIALLGAQGWGSRDRPPAGPQSVDDLAGGARATPRPGPTSWTTRRRSRSGMPSVAPVDRRSPSWSPTTGCASTCRTGCLEVSATLMAARCSAHRAEVERQGQAASRRSSLGAGLEPGADREPAAGRLPR